MANAKILAVKQQVIDEIKSTVDESSSIVLFDYRGLTDNASKALRRKLRETGSDYKVYKNTLVKRALDDMKIDLSEFLEGPNAIVFGKELLEPIKVLDKFAKNHKNVQVITGIIKGEVVSIDTIKEYASIPSMEGLLTMFAGGLIEHVKNLSVALNLYADKLGEEN